MPIAISKTPSSVSSEDIVAHNATGVQHIVSDEQYAGLLLPGSDELPLSQQLEPIAVIGMGCRLPGDVASPSDFWSMMMNKETGQTPKVPASRFNVDAHLHENMDRPGSFGVKGGYFLNETLKEFDPSFFGITPIEAMWMDPQQRKLLEVVYEAFESAGVTLDEISGSDTACFAATFTADFQQMSFKEPSFRHSLAATGVDPGLLSNRISHVFNLRGPSIVVNTACSSSVYALNNACNALRSRECEAAIVGGSNLILTVDQHMNTAKLGVLSPDSTCHTFNSYANGYGRAEGVGAVYLKRLKDAIRDGNPVRGVIRSSATNSNGKALSVGITYPGFDGQRQVMRHAYRRGGNLEPRLTGYFECHGTGTAIGDPLEVSAIADSMNYARTDQEGPLLIGAVKTNIGHSEAASGLSALIKAILTVERGIIPPTRGVTDRNPKIKWDDWRVSVATEPVAFPTRLPLRRVSVNSFGYGGTNAHVIVEAADSLLCAPQSYTYHAPGIKLKSKTARGYLGRRRPFLLPFSAHDKGALKRNILALGAVAQDYDLLDLSYTLAIRRTGFNSRAFLIANHESINTVFSDDFKNTVFAERKHTHAIAFAFTGQGAQWARMGASLMTYFPSFLRTIRSLDMVLGDLDDSPEWTIEDALLDEPSLSRINDAEYAQPLCTAVQVAIVELLGLWNIKPSVVCGHSSGEIAAAFAAGYITASEAIVYAFYRGRVVRDINTNGAMLAVGLGATGIDPYISQFKGQITLACHNSPASITLSGDADVLKELQKTLHRDGIFNRLVNTGGKAYHSHHMKPAAKKYETAIRAARGVIGSGITFMEKLPMVSSVTNEILPPDAVLDEKYWSANLLNPVLFHQAVKIIGSDKEFSDIDMIIEVGPHSALSGPIKQINAIHSFDAMEYLPSLIRNQDCTHSLLKLAGELFLRNYQIDLKRVTALEELSPSSKITAKTGKLIVDLPPYQWDNTKQFWAESRESREQRNPKYPRHDILGQRINGGSLTEPTWRNVIRIKDLPWLQDHALGGENVFPAAAYLSMAMEAITQITEIQSPETKIPGFIFRDVSINQALVTLNDDNGIEVLFNMHPSQHKAGSVSQWWDFNVSSISQDGYNKNHMAGTIAINGRARPAPRQIPNMPQRASGKSWYQALRSVGFNYGTTFQNLRSIAFDGKNYVASASSALKMTVDASNGESRHVLHPATIDGCLQLMIVAIWAGRTNSMQFGAIPVQAEEISIWVPSSSQLAHATGNAYSWIDPRGSRSFNAHNQFCAEDGQVLMEIRSMRCSAYEAAIPLQAGEVIRAQPYSSVQWERDVDMLTGTVDTSPSEYIRLTDFKNPGTKVLVADISLVTELVLKGPRLGFTIAVSTNEAVEYTKAEFAGYENVTVTALDLSKDLDEQGVKPGAFDLIISHIESDSMLANIEKLLTANGRAVVLPSVPLGHEACLGAGLLIKDLKLQIDNPNTRVVSRAFNVAPNSVNSDSVQVLCHTNKVKSLSQLHKAFGKVGIESIFTNLQNLNRTAQRILVWEDAEAPILHGIGKEDFEALQSSLTAASDVFWVSRGAVSEPQTFMASGLLRSIRSEQTSLNAILMTVDAEFTSPAQTADAAAWLTKKQLSHKEQIEREYHLVGQEIYISRLISSNRINEIHGPSLEDFQQVAFDPQQRLVGVIRSGRVIFDEFEATELGKSDVEVHVEATGLNEEDLAAISGTHFEPEFSHEIAGFVTRVGTAVENLQPGDKVTGFSPHRFATFQVMDQCLLQRLHDNETFVATAGLPIIFGSAIHGIENLANLQKGEKVLVLPRAGPLGHAAIIITKALGGTPFVATTGASEASKVQKYYDLGADQVLLWNKEPDFDDLADMDVVFSSPSVPAYIAREAWRRTPNFGRFIDCGVKDSSPRTLLDKTALLRNASFLSFNIIDICSSRPILAGKLLSRVMDLYRNNKIPPQQVSVHNITALNDCVSLFPRLQSQEKIVIEHSASDGFIDRFPSTPSLQLRPDATYFLVGCLGGLGRSITSWMMKKGARHFSFLSRSGADSEQAALLVADLEAAGASVNVFKGDASVLSDVCKAVLQIPKSTPVSGVINAAMVLKDGLFYNMPYENWQASIRPKINASHNLQEVFKNTPLDFFIMTSSVSGLLGTPGQSNYAAGNTYMDALARHRSSTGAKVASVILPMVLGVGVVAENRELEEALKRKGMYGIDQAAVLDAIEVAIIEQQDSAETGFDHLVVGLDPALLRKAEQEAEDEVDAFWAADARFNGLLHSMRASSSSDADGGAESALTRAKSTGDWFAAVDVIAEHFIRKMARILMLDVDEFSEGERSIASYGIDSMIGAELRNWIFKELALDIPFQRLLSADLTIKKFAEMVCASQGIAPK